MSKQKSLKVARESLYQAILDNNSEFEIAVKAGIFAALTKMSKSEIKEAFSGQELN